MDIEQAIQQRRSIRRFTSEAVSEETLLRLVEAGRMAPSAGNRQPWRFLVVREPEQVENLFRNVAWLATAGDPPEGQRPTAYIVILAEVGDAEGDERQAHLQRATSDCAAAAQNICLMAHALGLGSCWIGSLHRDDCRRLLGVPADLEIYAIIALGHPAEHPVAEEMEKHISVYRDEEGVLRVPKRRRDAVMRFNRWQ